jgi:hypothetical protein
LCKNKQYYIKRVHRIVLTTFKRSCKNKEECNHKNGIKSDNRLENLEWVTSSQNSKHRCNILHLGCHRGSKNPYAILTSKEVLTIRELCRRKHKQHRIAEWFNIAQSTVSKIKNNQTWRHV